MRQLHFKLRVNQNLTIKLFSECNNSYAEITLYWRFVFFQFKPVLTGSGTCYVRFEIQ